MEDLRKRVVYSEDGALLKDIKRTRDEGGMIRVEVRKIPRRVISVDELMVDDPTVFEFVPVKIFDFTLNR